MLFIHVFFMNDIIVKWYWLQGCSTGAVVLVTKDFKGQEQCLQVRICCDFQACRGGLAKYQTCLIFP